MAFQHLCRKNDVAAKFAHVRPLIGDVVNHLQLYSFRPDRLYSLLQRTNLLLFRQCRHTAMMPVCAQENAIKS